MQTENEKRENARKRQILGVYPDFAVAVRHILGWYEEDGRPFLVSRDASRMTGVNHSTITTMYTGDRPSSETIHRFAKGMGVDPNPLLKLAGYPALEPYPAAPTAFDRIWELGLPVATEDIARVPLSPLWASAGDARLLSEPGETEPETVKSLLPADVNAIRVQGDCMEPAFFHGDILFVRRTEAAESGDKVIALLTEDDSIKCKIYRKNGERYLEAINGEHPRIPASQFHILGVVVMFLRKT